MRDGKARVLTQAEFDNRVIPLVLTKPLPERNVAMSYLSFGCGFRVGEICSLNVGDLFTGDTYELKDEFALRKTNTKTKKSRQVYLTSKKVREALKAYIATQATPAMTRALFLSLKGHRMSGNSLQQVFARWYKAAGLDGCKSHTGRRTFANRLIRNGADLKSVKTLMGHESVTMTEQYVDDAPDVLRQVASKAI